jgi:acetylglutamate synthase
MTKLIKHGGYKCFATNKMERRKRKRIMNKSKNKNEIKKDHFKLFWSGKFPIFG